MNNQFNSKAKKQTDEKSRRLSRVEKTLLEVAGQYMSQVNHLFEGALVTLLRVSISSDLRHAKLFVSVFGGDEDEVLYELEEMRPEIQRRISKEVRMKFCPKLQFVIDDGIDKLTKVSDVLNNLENSKTEEDQ